MHGALRPAAPQASACRGQQVLAQPTRPVVPRLAGRRAAGRAVVAATPSAATTPLGRRRRRLLVAAASASSPTEAPAGGYAWSWADEQGDPSSSPCLPLPPLPEAGAAFADAATALAALQRAADVAASSSSSSSNGATTTTSSSSSSPPHLINAAEWAAQFAAASPPSLFSSTTSPSALCAALAAAAALPVAPPARWLGAALLEPLGAVLSSQSSSCGAKELASALWAASNLPLPLQGDDEAADAAATTTTTTTTTNTTLRALMAALEPQLQDLFAPDLARVVCAAGALARNASGGGGGSGASSPSSSSALPSTFAAAVVEEVTYQVTEFAADFGAYDLARLISGLADLTVVVATEAAASASASASSSSASSSSSDSLRAALSFPEQFSRTLMAAVYARTSTIAERGAVDFALAKLNTAQEFAAAVAAAGGPGSDGGAAFAKRSLHFDPRWTHEEMSACGWLPRHDRDKKRIIQRDWRRTQWGGFGGKD